MVVGARTPERSGQDLRDETLAPGDLLLRGQYRIDRYLGAGGFGITYLARDSLDRKVVIKECFPNAMCRRSENLVQARSRAMQTDFEAVVRQFGLEARRMSNLKHPNIVGVHQVFEDNGTSYMALDLVEGRELQDIIEHEWGQLAPAEIKRMLLQLLDAIRYLHERDILHRDISPDNILVDAGGNPVLIDFGAAREVATRTTRMLSSLHIVKDGYSPQEFYLSNNDQSPSSDLYALAATFHHLIAGSPPPNSQVRLAALAANEPDPYIPLPPRTEGYDHFFLGAISRALAVFPKDRLQSAQDWINEIDRMQRQNALLESARQDLEVERMIHKMTVETNRELRASAAQEAAAADPPRKPDFKANRTRPAGPKAPHAAPSAPATETTAVETGKGMRRAAPASVAAAPADPAGPRTPGRNASLFRRLWGIARFMPIQRDQRAQRTNWKEQN